MRCDELREVSGIMTKNVLVRRNVVDQIRKEDYEDNGRVGR